MKYKEKSEARLFLNSRGIFPSHRETLASLNDLIRELEYSERKDQVFNELSRTWLTFARLAQQAYIHPGNFIKQNHPKFLLMEFYDALFETKDLIVQVTMHYSHPSHLITIDTPLLKLAGELMEATTFEEVAKVYDL